MIVHNNVIQGTPEWATLRLGIPTASRFSDILTPKDMKPSKSANGYIAELVAEWALQTPLDGGSNAWMTRGHELESEARNWFSWEYDMPVTQAGFVTSDDGLVGCSPDGLVGDGAGLEIKCYEAGHHVQELLWPSEAHKAQIQGCLWITGRDSWYRVFYNPALPSKVMRIDRDPEFIAALESAIYREGDGFLARLAAAKQQFESEYGFTPAPVLKCVGVGSPCSFTTDIQEVAGVGLLCKVCREEYEFRQMVG
jgi:hypothetical protein